MLQLSPAEVWMRFIRVHVEDHEHTIGRF